MNLNHNGVKGRSLNTSKSIRAWQINEQLRKSRKTLAELYPNSELLVLFLNSEVFLKERKQLWLRSGWYNNNKAFR